MLVPLQERPETPTAWHNPSTGVTTICVNPSYQFRSPEYEAELRAVLVRHLGEAVTPEFLAAIINEADMVLVRAWSRCDLLVELSRSQKNDAPIPDPALRLEKVSAEALESGATMLTTHIVTGCESEEELLEEMELLFDAFAKGPGWELSLAERSAIFAFVDYLRTQGPEVPTEA